MERCSLEGRYGATTFHPMGHIIRRYSHEDDLKATEGKRDDEIVKLEAPATFAHTYRIEAPVLSSSVCSTIGQTASWLLKSERKPRNTAGPSSMPGAPSNP